MKEELPTEDLLPQMALVRENFDKARTSYMNNHKTFQLEKDARLTIYSHCIVAFDSAFLYLIFRTFDLPEDSWWDNLPQKIIEKFGITKPLILKPSPDNRKLIKDSVDSYWQYSVFILLFSSLESSIRTIIRTAYPGEFKDGRGHLTSIYKRLLGNKFSCYECLLKLFRLARNTMHNNGVYFPKDEGGDDHVTYKSKTYDFIDGQSVQYDNVSKLLFFDIAPDILKMINDIVNSPDVSKRDQIMDPST
ncbi:MAG: hypothetical protein M3044_05720 [Thermoproteota archaeon]|nr:hypothetical protein [Thermoproteota archaeon]